jgi:hypothetical protein
MEAIIGLGVVLALVLPLVAPCAIYAWRVNG